MTKLYGQTKDGQIPVENDLGEVFIIVSRTKILNSNFEVIRDLPLTVLENSGFELEQDWDNKETFINFLHDNGEVSQLVFGWDGVYIR